MNQVATMAKANEAPATTERAPMHRALRLAYLCTEYPKVSHTFIRREILELEKRGHHVLRLSIRDSGGAVADEADRLEAQRTFVCLNQPKWKIFVAAVMTKATHPVRWLKAFVTTWRMSRRSERGLMRHIAYLFEAALLLRILQRERVQHLHAHFGTNSTAVARLIRILGGPPYSFTVHGPDEFDAPIGFSLADKAKAAAFVVAISDFCAGQLKRWLTIADWDKIHVVHCTVGDQFFYSPQPIDPTSITLVSVGRLSAQKGQLLLIEAMGRLRDDGVEARLVLAGDGEMRPVIEQAIQKHGLQKHVRITGWVDEATVRQLLRDSRGLVQSSFAEGLPVVIMEALALGRPVITTMIAGIPELVRHGENGWLVPAGNVDELTNAMKLALALPAARLNEMGDAGRRRVRERHFTATEAGKLESHFLEACSPGGTA